VIVLSRDKAAVFSEIARVLRPGGRVGISDIVRVAPDIDGADPPDCGGGALTIEDYTSELRRAGLIGPSIRPTDPLGGGLSNAVISASARTQLDGPRSGNA
jgi:hypothetical protein